MRGAHVLKALTLAALFCLTGPGPGAHPQPPVLAPGYGALDYEPPPPGSYRLPPLGEAADGEVLDEQGRRRRLHGLFADRVVVLSFIYTSCSDVNGCPLSTAVLYRIKQAMDRDPGLAERLRLISLSFDPVHDTPQVMRAYGANFAQHDDRGRWLFLTASSEQALAPILEGYGQAVQKVHDDHGEVGGDYSHILRVFLIDPELRVRNIYSVAFLHADLILNDVRTLLLEPSAASVAASSGATQRPLSRAGDYKSGYEHEDYRTRSLSLAGRRGEPADLLAPIRQPPLGLPPVPVPADNPLTVEKVSLGRKLFYDRRLSLNDTFSCAMCHIPEQGFTSNELATAVGIEGRTVRRNTPTIYNVAYARQLFHDARENRLAQQVWAPLLARNEMGNPAVGWLLDKIRALSDYDGLFEAAFAGRGPSMETLGMALASYERTLVSGNSPFDRWRYGGDQDALSEGARRGFALFTGKAGCSACHLVGPDSALLTDHRLHNTGIGYRASMGAEPKTRRVLVAPGVYLDVDTSAIASVSERPPSDLGRYEITQDPADRWGYKTPGLRNVALTAPYMHDGSLATLDDVVAFYDGGGVPNEVLDPLIRPLGLSGQERADLVAFLESLSGDNVNLLVADAFAAPVGDLRRVDPDWARGPQGGP
jgi:cytochrome c peroxidase